MNAVRDLVDTLEAVALEPDQGQDLIRVVAAPLVLGAEKCVERDTLEVARSQKEAGNFDRFTFF